jgi:hypothetical protein
VYCEGKGGKVCEPQSMLGWISISAIFTSWHASFASLALTCVGGLRLQRLQTDFLFDYVIFFIIDNYPTFTKVTFFIACFLLYLKLKGF